MPATRESLGDHKSREGGAAGSQTSVAPTAVTGTPPSCSFGSWLSKPAFVYGADTIKSAKITSSPVVKIFSYQSFSIFQMLFLAGVTKEGSDLVILYTVPYLGKKKSRLNVSRAMEPLLLPPGTIPECLEGPGPRFCSRAKAECLPTHKALLKHIAHISGF